MRIRLLPFLLLWLLVASCARAPEPALHTTDTATLRALPAGSVVGYADATGAHAWRGIPFAKPPVGELRWRAPRPLEPWNGSRVALQPGPPCVQYPMPFVESNADVGPDGITGSEDCLTLNVFAPPFERAAVPGGAERLPVMVWIHGGANLMGESGTYDWSDFAVKQNVVVIATNYRLGLFGWFRHASLWNDADTDLDRSGNFGTLDLVRSLEWVRDNVSSFGGDPGNVTIFGESAGGNDVIALLIAPPAKGLFHRAIAQSGGTWSASVAQAENWTDDRDPGALFSSREVLARLLVNDRTAKDRSAAREHLKSWSAADTESYLRSTSASALQKLLENHSEVTMDSVPMTIREGFVVPKGPMIETYARGDFHRVPTILGTNRDEIKLFLLNDPEYVRNLFGILTRVRDVERYDRDSEYGSDIWKADGADEIAIEMRRVAGPLVWAYRFDWDEEPTRMGTNLSRLLGAAHGLEIPFVMGASSLGPIDELIASKKNTPGRELLSTRMGSYWANFARTGAPGRGTDGTLPAWTAWNHDTPETPRYMIFDTEEDGGLRMSADYVTGARIAARIDADPRFAEHERCDALTHLVEDLARFGEDDYAQRGCGEFNVAATGDE